MEPRDQILAALELFELDGNHRQVFDPNDLIKKGFPGELVWSVCKLIRMTDGDGYFLQVRGQMVESFVGVERFSFVLAIGKALDLDLDHVGDFTGRGFTMRAAIVEIEKEVVRARHLEFEQHSHSSQMRISEAKDVEVVEWRQLDQETWISAFQIDGTLVEEVTVSRNASGWSLVWPTISFRVMTYPLVLAPPEVADRCLRAFELARPK
jgi:hypothetical protein